MDYLYILIYAFVGWMLTTVTIPFLVSNKVLARRTALRMYHHTSKEPVSRLGGVALVVAFVAVVIANFLFFAEEGARLREVRWVVAVSSLAMFGLGLWDDLSPLGARKKLIGQLLIAAAVCYYGVRVENLQNPINGHLYALGGWTWVVTILWLVALTNIINLVDGVDGLAGGIGLMLMGLLVFTGHQRGLIFPMLCAAGLFGSLVGFLRYNFPPARIYMGDGGAYFLGFFIAVTALVYSQKGTLVAALIAPLLALALPILDVTLAIVRRGLRGLPIFRADREHIHHRLLKSGLSRQRTVLVLYSISLFFLVAAFVAFWIRDQALPILLGFIFLSLIFGSRMFDFSRHWLSVGRFWEDSQELRRETDYALTLSHWLQLEAERVESIEKLWEGFTFLAGKLGLARVTLTLADGERVVNLSALNAVKLQQIHDFSGASKMALRLEGDEHRMSEQMFAHVSELAMEAWVKACTRWQATTGKSLLFYPEKSPARE